MIRPQYDVVICGGGLAGLMLARHLRMRLPELSILVIEKMKRPLPVAAFKVGESTFNAGATYIEEIQGLKAYLEKEQVPKLGLRWFFSDPTLYDRPTDFAGVTELGRSRFLPYVPEWQIDRGKFEEDLREMVDAEGIQLIEGYKTKKIDLGGRSGPHVITIEDEAHVETTVRARWVIDSMGRSRRLQKQLGLTKKMSKPHLPSEPAVPLNPHTAVWWRVDTLLDMDVIVDRSNTEWHERTTGGAKRFNATSHFVGRGYWLWLIPLPDNRHSVGLVFNENEVAFEDVRTYEKVMAWMKVHQPEIFKLCEPHAPLDFLVLRDFTFSSKLVLSSDRWACVGDASAFADPYFSIGTTAIGYLNSLIVACIQDDLAGTLEPGLAEQLSDEWIDWVEDTTRRLHQLYSYFDRPVVKSGAILVQSAWVGINLPGFHSFRFLDGYRGMKTISYDDAFLRRAVRAQHLFERAFAFLDEWHAHPRASRLTYRWIDYAHSIRGIEKAFQRGWEDHGLPLTAHYENTFEMLEAVVLAVFLIAVEDVIPEALAKVQSAEVLNAWAISLDPARWEDDGLFEKPIGFNQPVDPKLVTDMRRETRALYQVKEGAPHAAARAR